MDDERRRRDELTRGRPAAGGGARASSHSSLRADEEQGVVVRRDRQRGERPPTPRARRPTAERVPEGEHRPCAEQREEGVGPRLLRVPDEERVHATSAAATRPARRETSTAPAPYATGIVAVPASAESVRSPTSPSPNSDPHAQATT